MQSKRHAGPMDGCSAVGVCEERMWHARIGLQARPIDDADGAWERDFNDEFVRRLISQQYIRIFTFDGSCSVEHIVLCSPSSSIACVYDNIDGLWVWKIYIREKRSQLFDGEQPRHFIAEGCER